VFDYGQKNPEESVADKATQVLKQAADKARACLHHELFHEYKEEYSKARELIIADMLAIARNVTAQPLDTIAVMLIRNLTKLEVLGILEARVEKKAQTFNIPAKEEKTDVQREGGGSS
jgi:hypothetical protein